MSCGEIRTLTLGHQLTFKLFDNKRRRDIKRDMSLHVQTCKDMYVFICLYMSYLKKIIPDKIRLFLRDFN